jgi:ribosomal protein S18 acetylase RimI-like enzyme
MEIEKQSLLASSQTMKSGNSKPDISIQPFVAENTAPLLQIAADTAFFGEPVEAFLEDRNLFCDIFYRYYTTLQAKYCWVAVDHLNVVGFLAGCPDTRSLARQWLSSILPGVLSNVVHGKYMIGTLTRHYLYSLVRMQLMERAPAVDLALYPAHLHVNLDANWRGMGIGGKLLQRYIEQLSQEHVPGVHLSTTDQNRSACKLYEQMGFQLLGSHTTHVWAHLINHPVEHRSYGLRI